ncbi:MAG TPA: ABC transporter permease [Clostridiaceae bacterium]|jgi:simple sugar transport system permease protein|nr:ABC transporter permease [Clostridiaceae bacterium]
MRSVLKKSDSNVIALSFLIVVILIAMALFMPDRFYTMSNLRSIVFQFPEYGVLAFGVMACMISGGIDISLVGIANLSGVIAATIMLGMGKSNLSIVLGILAALATGLLAGLFNGSLIGFLRLPPMLVTLCGSQLYAGLALIITKGPALNDLPDNYKFIANGSIGQIPVVLFVFIAVLVFVYFVMNRTVFGRQVRFMGSNYEAARYSGINNLKTTLRCYAFSGLMGAISGILMSSHFNSAKSDYGTQYTLFSILIVVLGGVHPDGGRGRVAGVTLSIILLQFITQLFTFLRIDTNYRTSAYGFILISVLVITMISDKRRLRRMT